MKKLALGLLALLFAPLVAIGQTDAELGARFTKISTYEVAPGVLMMARFGQDGKPSEFVFQRNHTTPGTVDLGTALSEPDIIALVEKIIPESERGKRTKGFLGKYDATTDVDGATMETEYKYERVSVIFYAGVGTGCVGDVVAVVRWRRVAKASKVIPLDCD